MSNNLVNSGNDRCPCTLAVKTIEVSEASANAGKQFNYCYLEEGIADDGVIEFIVTTGEQEAHLNYKGVSTGVASLYCYESPTTIAGGTSVQPRNINRKYVADNETEGNGTTVLRNPTSIGNDGTELEVDLIPSSAAPFSQGGAGERRPKRILNPNSVYLLRIKNLAGTAQTMALNINFCEHTNLS